jgi:hypothetical protein
MTKAIYAPRASVTLLLSAPDERNTCTCTKIPYKEFEVSISMDSSHGPGDLTRSDLRVYDAADKDVTFQLLPQYVEQGTVCADADTLLETFKAIDLAVESAQRCG